MPRARVTAQTYPTGAGQGAGGGDGVHLAGGPRLRPLRVGLVCPYSLTLPGGVQGQVLGLGEALRRQGIDARVLGPCDGPPPHAAVTPLGNSVPAAGNGSVAAIAPDPACVLRTIRALRDEEFDVLHLHEPLVPGPTLTALVFSEAPLVATFHRSGESLGYRAVRPLARFVGDRVAVGAAVSEEAEITARNAMAGHYERVWNGIDTSAYDAAVPWPSGGPTIVFVGRHEPRKGLAMLVAAMAGLGPDVRLWVMGEGPETARLQGQTQADPRIEWLGMVDEVEKVRRLRGATVFCAPSLAGESFGVVLLEAMAAGNAVVASDLAGYRNVARGGAEALLVAPGDVAALTSALRQTLAGGPAADAMVDAAQRRAQHFSLDALASRYLSLYRQALATAPGPA
ncbi:MAG: glycosyltransferase family 4 protein, partial [Actinomycetota bacterium]|nr:glycosyltransferase family 4 protein [Actinomycetota bacterium]